MSTPLIDLENHFYIQSVPKIQELCRPLMDILPVNFFYFERGYSATNKRLIFSSNKDWLCDYFLLQHHNNEMINFPKTLKNEKFFMSLWVHCTLKTHLSCQFWHSMQEKYAFANYFWLTWNYGHYIEVFGFAVEKGTNHPLQCFLYNKDIFLHFAQYFCSKGAELIKKGEQHMFTVPKPSNETPQSLHIFGIPAEDRMKYYRKALFQKIQLKGPFQDVILSFEEAKTMILLCKGMKYSEIAEALQLSEPTIKYRVGTVREKLNAKNKRELIDLFYNEQLLDICKYALHQPE